MIVDDLNVFRTAIDPAETNTKLHVDAQRVLALAILLQRMEPISWRERRSSSSAAASNALSSNWARLTN
jgi:hypothetical protein